MTTTAYGWLMLAGIFTSLFFWVRMAKRDERLVLVYVGALVSAFLGAKLMYLFAEGWLHWHDPDRWVQLATGKSIVGGLIGGYAGVEITKRLLGYTQARLVIGLPWSCRSELCSGAWAVCALHGYCVLARVCEPSWFTMNDAAGVTALAYGACRA